MPTITGATLTLTPGLNVTIAVTYTATFTPADRALVASGVTYHPHIDVFGIDPAGSLTGVFLALVPDLAFPVNAGVVNQVFLRNASAVVPRALLEEDIALGDDDEIRCKIRVHSVNLPLVPPPAFTPDVFTPERTLIS